MFRKRTRSYTKRRTPYAKRRRPANSRVRQPVRKPRRRMSSIRRTLPDYTMVAFKYQNMIHNLTLNGVPTTTRQWRLNSLYDPNYTVTNPGQHQPYGFDQYAVFFQKYRVFATKVTFEFMNPSYDTSTGAVPDLDLFCAMWPAPDPSTQLPGSNMNIIGEVAKAKHKLFSRKTGTSKRQVLSAFYRMHTLLGITKKEYNTDVAFEAFNGLNPLTTPLLNILCYNPFNISDNGTYDLKVNFTYYASMFRKKIPEMS